MDKQQLEIAKKIAKIEGVTLFQSGDEPRYWQCDPNGDTMINGRMYSDYNPYDWSILGPLMLKYGVSHNHRDGYVEIHTDKIECWVDFSAKEEIPLAILECIIKSQEAK